MPHFMFLEAVDTSVVDTAIVRDIYNGTSHPVAYSTGPLDLAKDKIIYPGCFDTILANLGDGIKVWFYDSADKFVKKILFQHKSNRKTGNHFIVFNRGADELGDPNTFQGIQVNTHETGKTQGDVDLLIYEEVVAIKNVGKTLLPNIVTVKDKIATESKLPTGVKGSSDSPIGLSYIGLYYPESSSHPVQSSDGDDLSNNGGNTEFIEDEPDSSVTVSGLFNIVGRSLPFF